LSPVATGTPCRATGVKSACRFKGSNVDGDFAEFMPDDSPTASADACNLIIGTALVCGIVAVAFALFGVAEGEPSVVLFTTTAGAVGNADVKPGEGMGGSAVTMVLPLKVILPVA